MALIGLVAGLHFTYLAVAWGIMAIPWWRFDRRDRVAGFFVGSQKTLSVRLHARRARAFCNGMPPDAARDGASRGHDAARDGTSWGQMGVPLANVLFAQQADVPIAFVTLPLLILHPFQLFVAGIMTASLKRAWRIVRHVGDHDAAAALIGAAGRGGAGRGGAGRAIHLGWADEGGPPPAWADAAAALPTVETGGGDPDHVALPAAGPDSHADVEALEMVTLGSPSSA